MDWALVAWITLRLTQRNIERIKEALLALIQEDPRLSALIFVVVTAVIVALIIRHARSLEKE